MQQDGERLYSLLAADLAEVGWSIGGLADR